MLLYLVVGFVVLFVVLFLIGRLIARLFETIEKKRNIKDKNRDIEDDNRVLEEVLGDFDAQREKEEIAGLITKGSSIIKGGPQNGSDV